MSRAFAATFTTSCRRLSILGILVTILVFALAAPAAFSADVTPPDPPSGVFVQQGSAWRADAHFDVSWQNPVPQESAIVAAHYALCPAMPLGECTTHQQPGDGVSSLSIDLPHVGWFWLRIWLEDAAGNVDPNKATLPVMLRFDDEAPPAGQLAGQSVWFNASDSSSPEVNIEMDPNVVVPLSGIGGYSVATGGLAPDEALDVSATQDNDRWPAELTLIDVPEGTTEIRIRSVSNTGVASLSAALGTVRRDASSPTITASGTADGKWQQEPAEVVVDAADQEGLSGMDPAAAGDPIETGGFISFATEGGSATQIRGGNAEILFDVDGVHALHVTATDRAGNTSPTYEFKVRIDRVPPTGMFEPQDAGDPRKLMVSVADAHSGVAGGYVEFRRVGASAFERLATARQGDELVARLDDLALADGRYEFRAFVQDVAGNEAVVTQRRGGEAMFLDLPVRVPTKIDVKAAPGKRCKPAKSKRPAAKRRAKRRCAAAQRAPLPYGKRLATTGTLGTANGGRVSGALVIVEGQARSGGPFVGLGTARTDAQGAFRFVLPAGPSRTVRYRYAGTDVNRPAAVDLSTKVAAAARLKVDRKKVRNGQTVRFTGRLLGKPIPKAGKIVALQAKVGGKWRAFATPRANAKGVFRHRYRFTSTTGLRRYAFRAVVAREAAYSYERGVSKAIRVTVRGQ